MNRLEELLLWLGPDGAEAGLEKSDLTIAELLELDLDGGIAHNAKLKRSEIIKALVLSVRKRLTKTPEELMKMDQESLRAYFSENKITRAEILTLLSDLDIRPGSAAKKNLAEYAAREISDIGMYRRVASGAGKNSG